MRNRYNPLNNKPTPRPKKSAPSAPQPALARAQRETSTANYQTIIDGFKERGIPEAEIKPRENVLTFRAWLEQGRVVRKGEHGIVIGGTTSDERKQEEKVDPATGVVTTGPRTRAWRSSVFHISQTDPIGEDKPQAKIVPVNFTAPASQPVPITNPGPRKSWRERLAERRGESLA